MENSVPKISKRAEANICDLNVRPILLPTVPFSEEDNKSTRNCFKATFATVPNKKGLLVIILPFCIPDNLCHFAAQEAAMSFD
jgi:hypothetical protein